MKLPTHDSYGWRNCSINMADKELKEKMAGRNETISDPWQFVNDTNHGITVWRINNCRATPLPFEVYGQFYQEEVFLILVIRIQPAPVEKRIHLWVGKYASTEDYQAGFQYATKLDHGLNKQTTLHREIQGFESPLFKKYFNPITYWNGKFEGSYWMKNVKHESYGARMLKLYKPSIHEDFAVAKEVPCRVEELDPSYTFILDIGKKLFLWHGNLTPTEDDLKSTRFVERMKANRGGDAQVEALDDDVEPDAHEFFTYLARGGSKMNSEDEPHGSTLTRESTLSAKKKVERVSYELFRIKQDKRASSFSMGYEKAKVSTKSTKSKLAFKDLEKYPISFYSSPSHVFVLMNKKMSKEESNIALQYGHDFLKQSTQPFRSLTVARYKQHCQQLKDQLQ